MNPGHDRDAAAPAGLFGHAGGAPDGRPDDAPPGRPDGVPHDGVPQHGRDDEFALTMNPRTAVLLLSGFVTVALVAAAFLMPVNYAVLRPGPALNTLGQENGKDLIAVSGHPSYPTTGALDLTTVSVLGGPGSHVELWQVVEGWLDPAVSVQPVEDVFPKGQTAEQSQQENEREMTSSQETATAAALTTLGVKVGTEVGIADVDKDAAAARTLRAGDVLVSINGVPTPTIEAIRPGLDKTTPGEAARIVVRRDGKQTPLDVTTRAGKDGKTQMGVIVETKFTFPFQVKIQIEDVGGPSAGTMFALGIIDKLTPGSLTGGKQIAGTGTMDADGTVGPIGGIRQKLVGARRAGAAWFLAPAANCDEVVGHVPDGLNVVRIETLADARADVEKIGRGAAPGDLPTCTAGTQAAPQPAP